MADDGEIEVVALDEDGLELVSVGAKIVELGFRLKGLRAERSGLDEQISQLERELNPLVVRHAQLIADLVGASPPSPAAPAVPEFGTPLPLAGAPVNAQLKERVRLFLRKAPPGVGAQEVAEALSIDSGVVRDVMREMCEHR